MREKSAFNALRSSDPQMMSLKLYKMYNLIKDDVYTFQKPKTYFWWHTHTKIQNVCSNQLKLSRGFACTSFKLIVRLKSKNLGDDNFNPKALASKFRLAFKILHLHIRRAITRSTCTNAVILNWSYSNSGLQQSNMQKVLFCWSGSTCPILNWF